MIRSYDIEGYLDGLSNNRGHFEFEMCGWTHYDWVEKVEHNHSFSRIKKMLK